MWKINKSYISDGHEGKAVEVQVESADFDAEKAKGLYREAIQLFDDDGEKYFSGYSYEATGDEQDAFSPLDNYGAAFGCTYMKYRKDDGTWHIL